MLKVANSVDIDNAKNELIEKVKNALNMEEIRRILENLHDLEITDELKVHKGDMVIHDNQIAYKMEFKVLLSLSVLLDSEGNYISPVETPEDNIENMGSEARDIIQDMALEDSETENESEQDMVLEDSESESEQDMALEDSESEEDA